MLVLSLVAFPYPDLFVLTCLANAKRTLTVGNVLFRRGEGRGGHA